MFNLFVFMSVVLTNICYNVCYSSNPDFSSKYDPEECYSTAKSFGDVGVFPDRDYDGTGMRIGIIENGIPYNTSTLPSGSQCYGNTYSSHCDDVTSIQGGNRNKGRLCLDNISFTDDINVTNNNYVCSYIEPIVIREDFSLPTD